MKKDETTKKDLVISEKFTIFANYQQDSMTIKLLIYLKRAKVNASGKAPLYLRISVGNQRSEVTLKRYVNPNDWDNKKQYVKGRNEEARSINEQTDAYKIAIHRHYSHLLKTGDIITADALKCAFMGIDVSSKSLNEAMEYHNLKLKEQVGHGYAQGTLDRFLTCHRLLKEFMKSKYKIDDIPLNRITLEFITEFDYFLRVTRKCNNNTTVKYIKNFKKIVNLALSLGWIDKDPFVNYKCKIEAVDRGCLHEHELEALKVKHFDIERLEAIKDIFLFSCYSGLAYADVQKLSKDNIVKGFDGNDWIHINRTKTNSLTSLPLLPIPKEILKKYANHPQCLANGRLLPVPSNQKVNAYLKEIADLCGIKKNLTFHLARHTFATTVTLLHDIPMETVSKMLGHKSIKTTQQYAKVLDSKISKDMRKLTQVFESNKEEQTKIIAI